MIETFYLYDKSQNSKQGTSQWLQNMLWVNCVTTL